MSEAPTPPDRLPMLETGRVLARHYRLVRSLGRGGMGVVWLAEDTKLEVQRALKFVPPELAHEEEAHRRLAREAMQVARLRHPNIVQVHSLEEDGPYRIIVMDYIPGWQHRGRVLSHLKDLLGVRGALPEDEVRNLLGPVLDALHYAHVFRDDKVRHGLVHRDIKPANILLEADGAPTLTDFGIAEMIHSSLTHVSGKAPGSGTVLYMPPEAIYGEMPDARSDIYSLGILTYELLTGAPPFVRGSILDQHKRKPAPLIPGVSDAMNALVQKATRKQRAERWQSCEEMRQALGGRRKTRGAGCTAAPGATISASSGPPAAMGVAQPVDNEPRDYTEMLSVGVELEMVWLKGGRFLMGAPEGEWEHLANEEPRHTVELSPFWIGRHPVTQEQYEVVMGRNPSSARGKPRRPVEMVSWEDATEFCRRLSEASHETYTLPTEAQWEYACRAGSETPFCFGQTISTDQANYDGSRTYLTGPRGRRSNGTTPVGFYAANAFGLHDMHGNVWEWCLDRFDADYYRSSPKRNPQGPEHGDGRVLRGGSWLCLPWLCRSAVRGVYDPSSRFDDVGFRLVRLP